MSFDQVFKLKADEAKMRASKSECVFSCQTVNISRSVGDDIMYPDHLELNELMKKLFSVTFVPKPLNEKALANGKTPEKPLRHDLLLVIIAGSETHVHIGVSVPASMKTDVDVEDFVKNFMQERKYDLETMNDGTGTFVVLKCLCEFPLKERDVVLQDVFNELKKRKIYVDDEEDVIYDFE